MNEFKRPFPYFGGKANPAPEIWRRFGDVGNYVEPFCGGLGCLLSRPHWRGKMETVNDKDGFICNFWRAASWRPKETAEWAGWPVNEIDLHSRHGWLKEQRKLLTEKLICDPEFCDPKVAGWWCWGQCCWIGQGWCLEQGHQKDVRSANRMCYGSRPDLGDKGRGVNRPGEDLGAYFVHLAERLRRVRVCCGDWSRVVSSTVTTRHGTTGILFDPPYSDNADRMSNLYAIDCKKVAHEAYRWALEHGDNPMLRIAFCGLENEWSFPGWTVYAWKSQGGSKPNKARERIWFSPNCEIRHATS